MRKRILCAVVMMVFACVLAVGMCAADVASEGLEFTRNDDGVSYSVTGIGTCTDTEVVIPEEYDGLPVTMIGDNAFYGNTSIKTMLIPESVTYIGDCAFMECESLISVNIPYGITSLNGTFQLTAIKTINIPDSVTTLMGTFVGCENLESVTLSKNLKEFKRI